MLVLYCYCLGNKSCAKRLAEYPAHVNFNGIADILLLFGLGSHKDIIVRETHDAFQLIYIQHAHLDVYDSVHGHELLYLASHFTVRFKYPYTDTFFCGDKVRGHLIHPGNQSEAHRTTKADGYFILIRFKWAVRPVRSSVRISSVKCNVSGWFA